MNSHTPLCFPLHQQNTFPQIGFYETTKAIFQARNASGIHWGQSFNEKRQSYLVQIEKPESTFKAYNF